MFLAGPEQDMAVTAAAMEGKHWHTTGIGFGMRGATNLEVIKKLEGQSAPGGVRWMPSSRVC